MKNILLLLLSLFVVSCSTTSYVREYTEPNYFSNLPTVSTTLTIVTYNSPQNYWYSNNIYTNHWPYTNNVYSNDYFGYYGNYTNYYLPNYYPNYYTPYYLGWYNNHCNNWNNHYYFSNGHRGFTPRTRQNYNAPRPVYYNTPRPTGGRTTTTQSNTPRTNTTQNNNYNTPRPTGGGRTTTSTPRQNNNNYTPRTTSGGSRTSTTPTRTTTGGRR